MIKKLNFFLQELKKNFLKKIYKSGRKSVMRGVVERGRKGERDEASRRSDVSGERDKRS